MNENDQDLSWVQEGRVMFGKDIWLLCLNTAEFHFYRLILRTSGQAQPDTDHTFIAHQHSRSKRFVGEKVINWEFEHQEEVADWRRKGNMVMSIRDSSIVYLQNYRREYAE